MRVKRQSGVQRRLGSLPRSLRLPGMNVTAPNLTRRDGNLSDTPNNLLMQKLKGLSVSLGGGEGRRRAWIMDLTSKRQRSVRFQRPPNRAGTKVFTHCHFLAGCSYVTIGLKNVLLWADVFVLGDGEKRKMRLLDEALLIARFPLSKWGGQWRTRINPRISPLLPCSLLTPSAVRWLVKDNLLKCRHSFYA